MQRHLGEEFDGYIAGVTAFGLFVELEELFVEGLVHISTLDDDLYSHMEKQHALVGRQNKRIFRIGDRVRIKVAGVSPATRRIEFVLANHTASAAGAGISPAHSAPEEYPRIPIKGKRITGNSPKNSTTSNDSAGGSRRAPKQPSGRKRR
jgi:ribonuclease R